MKDGNKAALSALALAAVCFGVIVSCESKADVCTSANCATKKPLSAMVSSDLIRWCDSNVPSGAQLCQSTAWIPWGGTSDFTKIWTDTGYFRRDQIPVSSAPPAAPFVAKPTTCLPKQLFGSGSIGAWEALADNDDRWSDPSIGVYACNDGYVYSRYAYAGVFTNKASDILEGVYRALNGDPLPLYALSVTGVNRPLTAAEITKRDQLFADLKLPPLWIVKTNSGKTTRPAYKLNNGVLGSSSGTATVGAPCDCSLRYTNSTSTYCGVTATTVTICAKN